VMNPERSLRLSRPLILSCRCSIHRSGRCGLRCSLFLKRQPSNCGAPRFDKNSGTRQPFV
jgi:hypothetical protein